MSFNGALSPAAAVVAVDVGKTKAAVLVSDATRHRLLGPLEFSMTAGGVAQVITRSRAVLPAGVTRVGVEAAGHYHRPLTAPSVWPGWEVVELNPAHVSEQRRVMGRRRVKTDALDLEAMTELLLAGRGLVVTAADIDRAAERLGGPPAPPGGESDRDEEPAAGPAGPLLPRVDVGVAGRAGHQGRPVGRRRVRGPASAGRLGPARFVRFAAARGLQVRRRVADRLVAAARDALPTPDAAVARQVLAADLALLAALNEQMQAAETRMGELVSASLFAPLLSRARLGGGAGRQLRRRGRRPGPLARPPAALPGFGAVPGPVRVGRPAPRRDDQPGRQRRAASGADRSRSGFVATGSRRETVRAGVAGPRQERWDHRLRDSAPSQQDRLRDGP